MYACELRQAKPRALGNPHNTPADPSMQASRLQPTLSATGSMMMSPDVRLSGATGLGTAAGRASLDAPAPQHLQSRTAKSSAAKSKRNLTVQVFLHCARIDVRPSPSLPCCVIACQCMHHAQQPWCSGPLKALCTSRSAFPVMSSAHCRGCKYQMHAKVSTGSCIKHVYSVCLRTAKLLSSKCPAPEPKWRCCLWFADLTD